MTLFEIRDCERCHHLDHLDHWCPMPGCTCAQSRVARIDDGPNLGERFDGSDYDPKRDDVRLTGQLARVYDVMADGKWRTVDEVCALTGDPTDQPVSVQSQLRHLRKERFGAYLVERRRRGGESSALWEYRVGTKGSGHPEKREAVIADLRAEVRRLRGLVIDLGGVP